MLNPMEIKFEKEYLRELFYYGVASGLFMNGSTFTATN